MAGKPIKCRAAVAWEAGKPLSIETIEVAPPKSKEVRVKIEATGVCHTDLHMKNGVDPGVTAAKANFPCILGHEGAGVVESVGNEVTKVKPGDHVIPLWLPECGECPTCRRPDSNICSQLSDSQARGVMPDGTTRFSCKGKQIHHFMGTSTFSEYTVLPDIAVVKVNPKAAMTDICLIGCGFTTGYGAAANSAKVKPGSTTAVWGLGGVGLSAIVGCKDSGASRIIGIDLNPDKFEKAKHFGCTECLNPADFDRPIEEVLHEMTGGGVDFTFECIGNVKTMRSAFEASHPVWGVTMIVGVATADDQLVFPPYKLLLGRTLKGSFFGGYKSNVGIPQLVDSYLEGRLPVAELITHTMAFEEINKAFDLMIEGKSIRSVVKFN
ncbi:alcohol dehydrogenase class-3-like [Limulus polyphemus]|uniref:Alcohol dehydrogenase class-3-like n=1 Tax=Limulus polyphemus TaxID=6850 RepID=A0ABM1BBU1_LIMPO|nr:alcohol dehydrogenase class-3-like [Limulus polyphemus]